MVIDYFALAVLILLATAAVAIWIILGVMPGRIASSRNHPQADAIRVCGWFGVLTMGLLLPLAYIWAYTNPNWRDDVPRGQDQTKAGDSSGAAGQNPKARLFCCHRPDKKISSSESTFDSKRLPHGRP